MWVSILCADFISFGYIPGSFVALFTTKVWIQLLCPSTGTWIKNGFNIYTMEYYSAIKNKIVPFVAKWTELEDVVLT
jgi:hypothetical protein